LRHTVRRSRPQFQGLTLPSAKGASNSFAFDPFFDAEIDGGILQILRLADAPSRAKRQRVAVTGRIRRLTADMIANYNIDVRGQNGLQVKT
jgi:hypothetical protein